MSLIHEAFNMMLSATKIFLGNPVIAIIFILSIIIIFFFEQNSKKKYIIIGFPIIVCVAIYNPITYWLCKKAFNGMIEYYCRLFSLLQLGLVISYAIVLVLSKTKDVIKLLFVILLSTLIIFGGNNIYKQDWIKKADNFEKISNDIIAVSNIINSDGKVHTIAVPDSMAPYIRQHDASFVMPYGRWQDNEFKRETSKTNPDVELIINMAIENCCEYVIVQNNKNNIEGFEKQNQSIVGKTNNFIVVEITNRDRYRKEYDSRGHITKIIHINENNDVSFNEDGFVYMVPEYNKNDLIIGYKYYGMKDELVMTKDGYASIRYELDSNGYIIKDMYFDVNDGLCNTKAGYAIVVYSVDENHERHEDAIYTFDGFRIL